MFVRQRGGGKKKVGILQDPIYGKRFSLGIFYARYIFTPFILHRRLLRATFLPLCTFLFQALFLSTGVR